MLADIATLENELEELRDDLFGDGELRRIIENIQQLVNDLINNLAAVIGELTIIKNLQTYCDTNTTAISGLQSQFTTLSNQLTAQIATINATVSALNDRLNLEIPKIVALQNTVGSLQTQITNLSNTKANIDWVNQAIAASFSQAGAPVGSIIMWPATGSEPPLPPYPTNWIPCHGQTLSRTQYSALFAVIDTSFTNFTNTDPTTFNIPNMPRWGQPSIYPVIPYVVYLIRAT
jgi:hypothetical protein